MIGHNIEQLMKAKGLTQARLASDVGISQGSLSAIISGKSIPKEATLNNIASALGVDAKSLHNVRKNYTPNVCPRCGSSSVIEWNNHGKGSCRIRCDYCEVDTGEQATREKALNVFLSFETPQKNQGRRASASARVLALSELLDSSFFDGEAVRPVWFENRGLFIAPALLAAGIAEREQSLVRVWWWNGNGHKSFMLDQYGSWWRCWNAKPTEAQSEATPWKD